MSKIPISVCIIAKNEEKYLEGCLQHLRPYGFEIVVADTGSTDRTKEIAAKYADKVVDFEWVDDFSAARNFCAAQAENNWILSIDCDEYLNRFDYQETRRMTQKFPRSVGRIEMKNLVMGADGVTRYTVDKLVRLYNRKRFIWKEPIHEQLVHADDPENVNHTFFEVPAEIIHHGYNISREEMIEKQHRNLEMLERQLAQAPEDPYLLFQVGQSQFVLTNYDKAVEAYEASLDKNPDKTRFFVPYLLESLSKAYINVNRTQDAVDLLVKYAEDFKTARYVYAIAGAYQENNQMLQALMTYIKATTLPDRDALGEGLFICYNNIIGIYKRMGEEKMADMYMQLYEKAKQERERIMNTTGDVER